MPQHDDRRRDDDGDQRCGDQDRQPPGGPQLRLVGLEAAEQVDGDDVVRQVAQGDT